MYESKHLEAAALREGSVEAPCDMDDVVVGDSEAASAHGSKLDPRNHDRINPLGGRQLALEDHLKPERDVEATNAHSSGAAAKS
jgi:hypothetical protein